MKTVAKIFKSFWAGEMAPWVKVLATKPDDICVHATAYPTTIRLVRFLIKAISAILPKDISA